MKGQKIYNVQRRGGQTAWIAADSIKEALAKARVFFNRTYSKPNVIEKIEFEGTIDA